MRHQARKWLSLLCALALMAGLVVVPAGAAVPLLDETVEEVPAGVGTMPAVGQPGVGQPQEQAVTLADTSSDYVHNFDTDGTTAHGIFASISGNLSSSKGTGSYNGLTISQCLKMESSTSIKLNIPEAGTMILVFATGEGGKSVKLDGEKTTVGTGGILRWEVTAGSHEITKGDTINLFYMEFQGSCPGHEYDEDHVNVVTEPTCTEPGQGVYLCIHCGAEGETYEIEAKGHTYKTEHTTLPTCASTGVDTKTCKDCGDVVTEIVPATGEHDTKGEGGACSVCGLKPGSEPCETHTMTTKSEKPATCTAAGELVEECSVCGMTVTTNIAATGHDWSGTWVQTKEPSCSQVGEETLACKNDCGETQKRDVAKISHVDADGDGLCDVCKTKLGEPLVGAGGWLEAMYVDTAQFQPDDVSEVSWTGAMTGSMGPGNRFGYDMDYLVRVNSAKTGTRIDIPGVRAGEYTLTVVLTTGTTYTANVTVTAHDRSGYAHWDPDTADHQYTEGVGAYRDDGILKDNAIVLYVTEENKNTVELELPDGTVVAGIGNILNSVGQESSEMPGFCKRTSGNKTYWGIANKNAGALKKLADNDIPLVVRIVGKVSSVHPAPADGGIDGLTAYDSWDYGGSDNDNGNMARMKDCKNITIEGIGDDAVVDGWGFHFMASSSTPNYGKNFEVRNITFRNVPEDCVGMEGVQSGSTITAPVLHGWVHNCSFYAPSISPAAESDKEGGDGACDFKRGEYFTMDYCYYEDYHKTNLIGSSDDSLQFNITWHHNYYVNCEARGPLVRNSNIHIYNCIYEDQRSYAMNPRANAYIYSEYNAFYNSKSPMQVKLGAIKSYNDVFSSCINDMQGTIVASRDEVVNVSANRYPSFELDSNLGYIKDLNYNLDTSIAAARQNILAYTGVMKSASQIVTPDQVDASTVAADRRPTAPVALPYDKDMNTTNAVVTGEKDNIIFNLSKLDNNRATFGGSSDYVGQNIVFLTDKVTNITVTAEGSSLVSLVNEEGQTVAEGGETAKNCPPGIYYIQPSTIQPGKNGNPANFKEGKITHLKIEEVTGADAVVHEHDYSVRTVVTAATCSAEGREKWSCPADGEFIIKSIPTIDHADNNGDGLCDVCDLEMTVITPADPDAPKVPVQSVTVTPETLDMREGDTAQLTAVILPADATNKAVAYSSDNNAVATVSSKGVVTAKGAGSATITVKASDNQSATVSVTVTAVQSQNFTFNAVDEGTLSADNAPAPAGTKRGTNNFLTVTGDGVVWRAKSSSNKAAASIQLASQESNGLSFTVPAGSEIREITITFSSTGSSNYSALALIDASGNRMPVASGNVVGKNGDLAYVQGTSGGSVTYQNLPAGTYTIVAPKNVLPADLGLTAFADAPSGSTSNPNDPNARGARIFTVNMTQITSTGGSTVAVSSVTLNKTSTSLKVGETETLTATVNPSTATDKTLTWSSSDAGVATVDSTGTIRGVAVGTAVITARASNGVAAACMVTVTPDQVIAITSMTISGPDQVDVENSITLTVTVAPADASYTDIQWTVDDDSVAKISAGGELTGLKDGTVTVTAIAVDATGVTSATKVVTVGEGAEEMLLDGAERDLGWRYSSATGQLTITGMTDEDTVLAATYDADGRMASVVKLTMDEAVAEITDAAAKLKLFWVNAVQQPMSEAATVYEK